MKSYKISEAHRSYVVEEKRQLKVYGLSAVRNKSKKVKVKVKSKK